VTSALHVARITQGYPPRLDGLSNHAFLLSRSQAARGHHVSVFQPHASTSTAGGVDVRLIAAGPLGLDPARRAGRWLFATLAARQLLRIHREAPVDVVHCHGDAPDAVPVGHVARRLRLPLVLTLHGGLSRTRRYRVVAPRIFDQVDRFIVVAEHIRSDLERMGVDPVRVSVISSGIEYGRFAETTAVGAERAAFRADLGVPADAMVIAAVGRLHPVKGFDDLIAAAHALPPDTIVAIVGDGPARPELERAARGLPNVRLCGARSPEAMPALLRAADLFVLPSVDLPRQAEGSPTTVMEAMAAGLPLVVSDSGGAQHLVAPHGGGLVVSQRSPTRLAEAIRALVGDPERRRAMGAANRDAARARDWELVTDRVIEVYRRAIAERGKNR